MGLWAAWNRRKRSEIAEKRSSRETSIHVDSTSMLSDEQISSLPPFLKAFCIGKNTLKRMGKSNTARKMHVLKEKGFSSISKNIPSQNSNYLGIIPLLKFTEQSNSSNLRNTSGGNNVCSSKLSHSRVLT